MVLSCGLGLKHDNKQNQHFPPISLQTNMAAKDSAKEAEKNETFSRLQC